MFIKTANYFNLEAVSLYIYIQYTMLYKAIAVFLSFRIKNVP